jgi:potassium/hydrogen antiporter
MRKPCAASPQVQRAVRLHAGGDPRGRRGPVACVHPRPGAPIDPHLLLLVGVLLVLSVIAAVAATRAGLPVLVAFLVLGMLLGSDGPGGIDFDDADLARAVGTIGLLAILWEGGLTTRWRDVRPVLGPAALLATLGVVVTAVVVGLAGLVLFDLTGPEAMLLGAVVGSTDAAAVFATLRFTTLRRRIGALLEAESGLNDPMAVALTLGLIEWVRAPDGYGLVDLLPTIARSLGIGLLAGLVLGRAAGWIISRAPLSAGPFVPVVSVGLAAIAFAAPEAIGGSGFLSVYLVALVVGNTPNAFRRSLSTFHEGLAFIAQIVLFGVLGLLVFPGELGAVVASGLILTLVLVLVARPAAVWVCTVGQGFDARERVLLSWAGLRGAVPIVLATFALSEGLEASETIFNAVFFVVLLSAAIQGPVLTPLARRLGLAEGSRALYDAPLEVGPVGGADLLEYTVRAGDGADGRLVRDLGLPRSALVAVVVRADEAIPPRGSTRVTAGDRLYVLTRAQTLREVETAMAAWRDAGEG